MKTKDISSYKSLGNTVVTKTYVDESDKGGIILPDEAKETNFFEVVETGILFDSLDIKIGDLVLVAGKGGDRIDLQDTTYWIFPTDMIIAVLER